MNIRRKVTGLGGYTIHEIRHTDGDMLHVKLTAKGRTTRIIEIRVDSLFDGDGNLFEVNAAYVPRRDLEGVK